MTCRALHEENPTSRVHPYSMNTTTGSLWSHLLKNHMQEWVSECQKLGIVLKGKEGEEAFAQFTGLPVQHQAEARIPFSQVTFLDALMQFIIGTDQVFFLLYEYFSSFNLIFFSPCELWRERSFAICASCFTLSCETQISLIGLVCTSTSLRLVRKHLMI